MSFRAVQNGDRVLLLVNGKLLADLDCDSALETGRAIMGVARMAQEIKQASKVIEDAALMLRCTGLGLAHNRAIMREARTMAQWDSKMRRVPAIDGIPTEEKIGRPAVYHSRGTR